MYHIKTYQGDYDASGHKVAIVVSRFNDLITEKLMQGATDTLIRCGANREDLTIVRVPGSFEIPMTASRLVQKGGFDSIICLGSLIRGATPHFEYLSAEVIKGVAQVGLQSGIPIIFGVLTTDTIEQAVERAGTKLGNKGHNAALSAIEMVNLYKKLKEE